MARQTGSHTFIKSIGNTTGYKKVYTKKNNNFEKIKAGIKKSSIESNTNLSKIKSNNSEFFPANFTAIKISKLLKNIIINKSGALRYRLFKKFLSIIRNENGTTGERPFDIYSKLVEMNNFMLGDYFFNDGFGLKYNFFYDGPNDNFIFRPIEDIDTNKIAHPSSANVLRFGLIIFGINNMTYNPDTKKYSLPLGYNYFLPKLSYSNWIDIQNFAIPTFDTTIKKFTPNITNNELLCVGLFLEHGLKNNSYISKLRYKSFATIVFTYNNSSL